MTYRKAILIYAYAIPVSITLVLAVVILIVVRNFQVSQNDKILDYQKYDSLARQVMGMEAQIREKDPILKAWREALASESKSAFNIRWGEISKSLDGRQLEQSSFAQVSSGNGLGLPGGQPVNRLQVEFRGGFEPMQSTLLMMESRLPQLQLESADIQPDANSENLRFIFTYSAWEQFNNR